MVRCTSVSNLCGILRGGDSTDLLEKTECVCLCPELDDPSGCYPVDDDGRNVDVPPTRGDSHEATGVRSHDVAPENYLVSFGDKVLFVKLVSGQPFVEHDDVFFQGGVRYISIERLLPVFSKEVEIVADELLGDVGIHSASRLN